MTKRMLALALLIGLTGCRTQRTAYYASPGCASCGGYPAAPEARLRPQRLPASPPPLSVPGDPLLDNGPSARISPPSVRAESKSPPLAVPPLPSDDDSPLPIDLPGFMVVKPRVANGLKPFPEGIDWLKAKGYRTALHLRAPGDDGAAAKRLFEKKGLDYRSLDVSAATLDEEKLKEFSAIVGDEKLYPLFVYDKDGSVAGGMWYLHNRIALGESDERSKAEAARLGLRLDDDGDHRTMWLAVQSLAAKLKP